MSQRTEVNKREKEFFDRDYETRTASGVERFHAANEPMHDHFIKLMLQYGSNKHVLELGCGRDPFATMLQEQNAEVTAIDISSVAIEKSRRENDETKRHPIHYLEMNAEQLEFPDNSFDLVFGAGILHHIDFKQALQEIHRVLKPGGKVLFAEPLAMNPVLSLYRICTPSLRTPDEHPLKPAELALFRNQFQHASFTHYTLFAPVVALFPTAVRKTLYSLVWKIDSWLLRLPVLRYWSWVVVFTGSKE